MEHARGIAALLYLIFSEISIVGYSAFCVRNGPAARWAIVSIYPYINAVVAVGLGWLFYREPFGLREAMAMIVIFGGVALVKLYSLQSIR